MAFCNSGDAILWSSTVWSAVDISLEVLIYILLFAMIG